MHEITIALSSQTSDNVKVQVIDKTNKISKLVRWVDFCETIKRQNQAALTTPILPYGTRLFVRSNNTLYVVLTRPGRKSTIIANYRNHDREPITVPLPNSLIIGSYTDEITPYKNLEIWCYKEPLTINSQLFQFPLGNTFDHGGVCWGTTVIPQEFKLMSNLDKLFALFFGTGFNGHIANSKYTTYTQIKELSKLDIFNDLTLTSSNYVLRGRLTS